MTILPSETTRLHKGGDGAAINVKSHLPTSRLNVTWPNELDEVFHLCSMTILPLDATQNTANSDSRLDVFTVSDTTQVPHFGQFPALGLSKHYLIYLIYNICPSKFKPKFNKIRHYTCVNTYDFLFESSIQP